MTWRGSLFRPSRGQNAKCRMQNAEGEGGGQPCVWEPQRSAEKLSSHELRSRVVGAKCRFPRTLKWLQISDFRFQIVGCHPEASNWLQIAECSFQGVNRGIYLQCKENWVQISDFRFPNNLLGSASDFYQRSRL